MCIFLKVKLRLQRKKPREKADEDKYDMRHKKQHIRSTCNWIVLMKQPEPSATILNATFVTNIWFHGKIIIFHILPLESKYLAI